MTGGEITSSAEVANLGHPLDALQVFGIWPATDFRDRPHDAPATYVLIATCSSGSSPVSCSPAPPGASGSRSTSPPAPAGSYSSSRLEHVGLSSPWLNAKAMAEASPAAGRSGRRRRGGAVRERAAGRGDSVIGAAIAAGVLWSNGLSYSNAGSLRAGRLAELQSIGHRFAGQGPALMTDAEPYGVAALPPEPRSRGRVGSPAPADPAPQRTGSRQGLVRRPRPVPARRLLVYRTLVLARSPSESRPPSIYRLVLAAAATTTSGSGPIGTRDPRPHSARRRRPAGAACRHAAR